MMLEQLRQEGFRLLDLELAALLQRMATAGGLPSLGLGAALASAWRRNRHSCLPLGTVAGQALGRAAGEWGTHAPLLAAWREDLLASGMVSRGGTGYAAPLVLDDGDRLYLQRMHAAECAVARGVLARLTPLPVPSGLDALLEDTTILARADDEQGQAVRSAFARRFNVLTGGPGTGKTSTLGLLLALALNVEPGLRVSLSAPTGKAAARMQEALESALPRLPERLRGALSALAPARTLHHLLLERPAIDWLIIDEASMVDLPMMARLLEFLPDSARLLLIGDADQLASVEAGAVLSELVEGLTSEGGSPPPVSWLRQSRRFTAGSDIGDLAEAVRTGAADQALQLLSSGGVDVAWIRPGAPGWNAELAAALSSGTAAFRESGDMRSALASLDKFRVVCAQRAGRLGLEGINAWCASRWQRPGDQARTPILVRVNDPVQGLSNGDMGVLQEGSGDRGAICLLAPGGTPQEIAAARLPRFDPAWAITVHQCQGSEAEDILLILPDAPSPLLCRELLYTGLTRARRRLTVVAAEEALRLAIGRRADRCSGLADRLRGWSVGRAQSAWNGTQGPALSGRKGLSSNHGKAG